MNELQASEPHRFAHAARQPPAVRRPLPAGIRVGARAAAAAVAARARYRPLQGTTTTGTVTRRVTRRSRWSPHALRRYARKPFVACRYGGEEFCVILPGHSTAKSAALVAERLRAAVQDAVPGELAITISVGYACLSGDEFREPREVVRSGRRRALRRQGQQAATASWNSDGRRSGDPSPPSRRRLSFPQPRSALCHFLLQGHRLDHNCRERHGRAETERAGTADHGRVLDARRLLHPRGARGRRRRDRPAYTTVQTMVYRLEAKGALRRTKKIGNAHIFEATTSRASVQTRLLKELLGLFDGNVTPGHGAPGGDGQDLERRHRRSAEAAARAYREGPFAKDKGK